MKKLLLTLGAVASVAAPVAAVVACSSTPDATLSTDDQVKKLNAIISPKGYVVTKGATNLDAILKTLFAKGTNPQVVKYVDGKAGDATHGANDFAILIKNGAMDEKTGDITAAEEASVLTKGASRTNWGFEEADLLASDLIVYVQVGKDTDKGALEIYEVRQDQSGEIYGYDSPEDNKDVEVAFATPTTA